MKIYISRNGQQLGPYTLSEVQNLAATGRVSAGDWAFYDGAPDWIPLSQVPGFSFVPAHPVGAPPSASALSANPGIAASPAAPVTSPMRHRPALVWIICLLQFIYAPFGMFYLATAPHRLTPILHRLQQFETHVDFAIIRNTDVSKRERLFSVRDRLQAAEDSLGYVSGIPYICLGEALSVAWLVAAIYLFQLRQQAVSLYLALSVFSFLQQLYGYVFHRMLQALASAPQGVWILAATAVGWALVVLVNLYIRKLDRKGVLH